MPGYSIVYLFNGISLDIMKDVFPLNTSPNYNIRNGSTFSSRPVNSVYNGTESISHLASKIWELVPSDIKTLAPLPEFKKYDKIMESCEVPLQNLQNLYSTSCLRVVDVIFIFLISSLTVWRTGTMPGM